MELFNALPSTEANTLDSIHPGVIKETVNTILLLLSPMVPHFSAEMWQVCGNPEPLTKMKWPQFDEDAAKEDKLTIVIQINGKVRSRIEVSADEDDEAIKLMALTEEKANRFLEGKTVKKVIVVKKKLVNIVV